MAEHIINSPKYGRFVVLVDEADLPLMQAHSWCIERKALRRDGTRSGPYVVRRNRPHLNLYLHRHLMGQVDGLVDHINRNTLDNRRCNMRVATKAQNTANKPKQSNNKSGYIGVAKIGNRWVARIAARKNRIHVGAFDNPMEAAIARDNAAIGLYGEFAVLNFPIIHG